MKVRLNWAYVRNFSASWNGRVITLGVVGGALGWVLDANHLSLAVWVILSLLFPVLSIWPPVYLAVRTLFVIGGEWFGAELAWAAIFVGIARWLFELDEEAALLWVGLPVFMVFLLFCIFILPKYLKKRGFCSDVMSECSQQFSCWNSSSDCFKSSPLGAGF